MSATSVDRRTTCPSAKRSAARAGLIANVLERQQREDLRLLAFGDGERVLRALHRTEHAGERRARSGEVGELVDRLAQALDGGGWIIRVLSLLRLREEQLERLGDTAARALLCQPLAVLGVAQRLEGRADRWKPSGSFSRRVLAHLREVRALQSGAVDVRGTPRTSKGPCGSESSERASRRSRCAACSSHLTEDRRELR